MLLGIGASLLNIITSGSTVPVALVSDVVVDDCDRKSPPGFHSVNATVSVLVGFAPIS